MGFRELRKKLPIEEFDYQLLLAYLATYATPRGKIHRLLGDKKIIRIKKGLYVFGPDYQKGPICKEALANLIYGPSYISYQYALSYYGMIPERVEVITSATLGKSKMFHTPIGSFSYQHVNTDYFPVGVTLMNMDLYHAPLIATPEKALADQILTEKGLNPNFNIEQYLYEDLRIDPSTIKQLSLSRLLEIQNVSNHSRLQSLVKFIKKEQADA